MSKERKIMALTEKRIKELNFERANTLIPELRDICLEGLDILWENGWRPLVVQAMRSQAEQNAIYSQGRADLETTNHLREIAGLDPIEEDENNRKVTWVKHSKHNDGLAFDIVNINEQGKADWNDDEFYKAAVVVFKEYGLIAGYNWTKTQDKPHFERQ